MTMQNKSRYGQKILFPDSIFFIVALVLLLFSFHTFSRFAEQSADFRNNSTVNLCATDQFGNAKSAVRISTGVQLQHSRSLGRPIQLVQGLRQQSLQTLIVCLFLAVAAFLKQCRFFSCRITEQTFSFQYYLKTSLPVRAGPVCA